MGIYKPEELQKIRENIEKGLARSTTLSRMWKPDWTLHEKLGLDIPDLMTKDEFDAYIAANRWTPYEESARVSELWTPYINAEISRVTKLAESRPPTDAEKTFMVLGGASGTGKSSFKNLLMSGYDQGKFAYWSRSYFDILKNALPGYAVDVDPDNGKLILPEYQAHLQHLTPGGASFVHQESRNIAEQLRQRAVSLGLPTLYDTSGQFNNGAETLDEVKGLGYRVDAVYFMADMQTLIDRVKLRERQSGRGVPSSIVRTIQQNLYSIIPQLWTNQKFDRLTIIDSTDLENMQVMLHVTRLPDGTVDVTSTMGLAMDKLKGYFGFNQWWTQ